MSEIIKLKRPNKNGGRYIFRCQYKDIFGNTKYYSSGAFRTKSECEDAAAEFKLNRNKYVSKKNNMTFKELYDVFYEFKKSEVTSTTLNTYEDRKPYLAILNEVKLEEFNYAMFEEWKKEINKTNLSLVTKNSVYKLLRSIMNYAIKKYNITFTDVYYKMEKFKDPNEIPTEMDYYTFDEFQKYISVEEDILFKTFFITLYYQGMRKGEIRALTWKDVDFEANEIKIKKSIVDNIDGERYIVKKTKTKSSVRTIPMFPETVKQLKLLHEEVKKYSNYKQSWFIFGNSLPLGDDKIYRRNKLNAERADLKKIRIHDFRHSCASLLINNGADITMVAKFLGHSKIDETLNTYSHLYKGKLNSIVENMQNIEYKN